jgi:NO-binding membrane sensor protein with MHYT domain
MRSDRQPYHIFEALGLLLVGAVFGGIVWGMIFVGMVTGFKIGLPIEKPIFDSAWILIWPALGMAGSLILINQGKPG